MVPTTIIEALKKDRFNHSYHSLIDICDDYVAGSILSQILYWFSPTPDGKPRVRIERDGYYWLAKKMTDWYEEVRVTPKQAKRAISKLENLGLIETRVYKFAGSPTTHIRPCYCEIEKKLHEYGTCNITEKGLAEDVLDREDGIDSVEMSQRDKWKCPKGINGLVPSGHMECVNKDISYTESTSQSTREISSSREDDDVADIDKGLNNRLSDLINTIKRIYLSANDNTSLPLSCVMDILQELQSIPLDETVIDGITCWNYIRHVATLSEADIRELIQRISDNWQSISAPKAYILQALYKASCRSGRNDHKTNGPVFMRCMKRDDDQYNVFVNLVEQGYKHKAV